MKTSLMYRVVQKVSYELLRLIVIPVNCIKYTRRTTNSTFFLSIKCKVSSAKLLLLLNNLFLAILKINLHIK